MIWEHTIDDQQYWMQFWGAVKLNSFGKILMCEFAKYYNYKLKTSNSQCQCFVLVFDAFTNVNGPWRFRLRKSLLVHANLPLFNAAGCAWTRKLRLVQARCCGIHIVTKKIVLCHSNQVTLAIADIHRLGSPNENSYATACSDALVYWYIKAFTITTSHTHTFNSTELNSTQLQLDSWQQHIDQRFIQQWAKAHKVVTDT